MTKILLATVTVALLAASVPSYAQQTTTKDQLVGTWKIAALKATSGDKVSYPSRGAAGRRRQHHPPTGFD